MNTPSLLQRLTPARLALIVAALYIAANAALALLRLLNRNFNPDEFQHMHIAWLMAGGDMIYRDFWEHHGPLYALFNSAAIYLFDPEPGLRIMFAARLVSFVIMGFVGVMTWQMARQLSLSQLGAWLAAAAYAGLYMVQNKGIEMRPDIFQAVFWIAGLLLLIINQKKCSFRIAAAAGAMFALTILSNAKAGIGPFFAVFFYCIAHWVCGMKWQDIRRDLSGMIVGGLLAALPVLTYFWLNDAALDFLYFNFVWNVEFIVHFSSDFQTGFTDSGMSLSQEQFWFYVHEQLPFFLLAIAGACFWLVKLYRERDQRTRQQYWLFMIATAGTTLGWVTDQHTQYFLIFLPLLSILCAESLTAIPRLMPASRPFAGKALATAVAVLSAVVMLNHAIASAPFKQVDLLYQQKWFTNKMLSETERDEPLGILWSLCGGYMFNRHVGFYWVAMPAHSEIIEIISGEHPFRESFIAELEERNVRYVIGMENWMMEGLSTQALQYLRLNYEYSNCLWTRREAG